MRERIACDTPLGFRLSDVGMHMPSWKFILWARVWLPSAGRGTGTPAGHVAPNATLTSLKRGEYRRNNEPSGQCTSHTQAPSYATMVDNKHAIHALPVNSIKSHRYERATSLNQFEPLWADMEVIWTSGTIRG